MKKTNSIIVNKHKYYLYKIEWVDIFGDAGHFYLKKVKSLFTLLVHMIIMMKNFQIVMYFL